MAGTKHANESRSKIMSCTCEHNAAVIDPTGKYPGCRGQDEIYGKGKRLFNPCKLDSYKCTVCGNEKKG